MLPVKTEYTALKIAECYIKIHYTCTCAVYAYCMTIHSVLLKQNLRRDMEGMVWVEPVATRKLLGSPYLHTKGNSILKYLVLGE